MKTVYLLLLIVLCSDLALAQQPRFEHFTTSDGLPGSETYNLYQDRKGYIWIFTAYGIVKYNGVGFVPVCTNLKFQESIIYAVNESPDSVLYFSNANNVIYQVRNDSAFMVKGGNLLAKMLHPGFFVKNIVIDGHKNIYLQETNHFCYRLSAHGVLSELSLGTEQRVRYVYRHISNDGFIRMGCPYEKPDTTVRIEEGNTITQFVLPALLLRDNIFTAKRNENGIYINGQKSMVCFDRATRCTRFLNLNAMVTKYKFTPDGHLWIGTHNTGFYETDKDLNILNHYLDGLSVSDILQDREQGIWVSTLEQGVFYWKNRQEKYYNNVSGLSGWITMLKEINGLLFFSTYQGKLFALKKDSVIAIGKIKGSPQVHDMIRLSDRYVIATMDGLYTMDTCLRTLRKAGTEKQLPSLYLSYQLQQKRDDSFYSVAGNAIIVWQGDHVLYGQFLPEKARCMTSRSNGQLLVGTHIGVFEYGQMHLKSPIYLGVVKNKVVHHMKEDLRHTVWILTKGEGIYLLHPGNSVDSIPNLPSAFINDVYFTEDSSVLLATNKGLFINTYAGIKTRPWRQLFFDECLQATSYNGKIFIGTREGLVSLQHTAEGAKNTIPVYLSSIIVNGQPINNWNGQLSYKQNDIYLNFDFLDYPFPQKEFEYKLKGPYEAGAIVKGTQLHLQNLSPGDYTLSIRLLNLPDRYENTPFQLHFFIKPAFWQTRFFLIIVTILVIVLAYTTGRILQVRVRRTERKKAYINNLLSEYKITALKAQVNPHFISNSLAAIQQLILDNEVDKAGLYMARFSLFIRYVLKYSDQALARLSEELKIIDLNIELEQLRFDDGFVFEKQIDDDIDSDELFIPPMITQPFIENAIWHGILPLKGKRTGKLVLKIVKQADELTISVIDNGVGRQKTASQHIADVQESKGTWLITQRLENMNQVYPDSNSRMQLFDLLDTNQQPCGTQVDIIIPANLHEKM